MLQVVVFFCVIVLFAMCIDLASGLYKAKQRGEVRSSYGLKRTLSKFITYEGGMLIAAGVDIMILYCKMYELFHINILVGIPVITGLVGIFLCVVEFISVREKADKKIKREMSDAATLLSKMLENDTFKEAFRLAIEQQAKKGVDDEQ
jgi:hypothetical protein